MVSIRQMSPEELTQVEEIDVSESGDLVSYYREGKIATKREAQHRGPRNAKAWGSYIERILQVCLVIQQALDETRVAEAINPLRILQVA